MITIAVVQSTLEEFSPPWTWEPIQTHASGIPKPTIAATTTVATRTPIPLTELTARSSQSGGCGDQ
jgi:hypothetical protein